LGEEWLVIQHACLIHSFIACSFNHVWSKKKFLKIKKPGMVAHVYNPSYLGGGDKIVIQDQPGQKARRPPPTNKKLGVVSHGCHLSYVGGATRRISCPGQPGQKH
jgi:hypothetical protein